MEAAVVVQGLSRLQLAGTTRSNIVTCLPTHGPGLDAESVGEGAMVSAMKGLRDLVPVIVFACSNIKMKS